MKTQLLKPVGLGIVLAGVIFLSAFDGYKSRGYHDTGGISGSCASPGEPGTCSRSGCHGAGATPAGIPDNTGPGSVSFSTSPVMTSNQYIPGTTYTVTVTVSQTGKKRFGFACEILDNSGSTNGHINNSAGTITVTDHIHTRTWYAFGSGRMDITQDTLGGLAANTASFNFNWTAPAKGFGTVNVYLCGNAANHDALADSGDYIYSQHIVLTEGVPTNVNEVTSTITGINIFPNPTSQFINLSATISEAGNLTIELYSMDGKMARTLENTTASAGAFTRNYSISDLPKGIYLVRVTNNDYTSAKPLIIQ